MPVVGPDLRANSCGVNVAHMYMYMDEYRFNSYHRGSVSRSEVEAGSEDECY